MKKSFLIDRLHPYDIMGADIISVQEEYENAAEYYFHHRDDPVEEYPSEVLRWTMKQIFESERIRFVDVSELLVKDYLAMVNDIENVEKYLGGAHEPFTEEQELAWVREKLENNALVFSMIEKSSGQFIGNVELMDVKDREGELGIAITARKQNMGFGTEAVLALAGYGMERLGLERVRLRVHPENARAIHVYEKCGFREYQRTDRHICMEKR